MILILFEPNDPLFSANTTYPYVTAIRLLEEQSDHFLHSFSFHLHFLGRFFYGMTSLLEFKGDNSKNFGYPEI